MITHSQLFFSDVLLHNLCLGGMRGGLPQPSLHLPALPEDTSLSSCLCAVTSMLCYPWWAHHSSYCLHWHFTYVTSFAWHGLRSIYVTLAPAKLMGPWTEKQWQSAGDQEPSAGTATLQPDPWSLPLHLAWKWHAESFGLDFAMFNLQGWTYSTEIALYKCAKLS